LGDELRTARLSAGLSTRFLGALVGVSHSEIRRIESAVAPHVSIAVLERMAAALGCELSLRMHPIASALRDAGHLALLARLAARLPPTLGLRTEVPMPVALDLRSADGVIRGARVDAIVEAETRLYDLQSVERRLRSKQRDLGCRRAILLVADTRHNRAVLAGVPDLATRFPVGTRACLAALRRGDDPGGDCLVVL
jgi:transcriptional regulator with XRE-family HTH domain